MSNKKPPSYDSAYKYLFSNKRIFLQLLHSFVKEDFVKTITLKDIEPFDKTFISDKFIKRESDIIYKINLKNRTAYIYVLLEFQSSPDKTIPVRMLLYILQLCDLIYRNSQKGKLPAIFPILLYTGSANWNIPKNVKDLFDQNIPGKYIPSFDYYLISEKDIPDQVLLKLHNLIAAVVYLEKRRDEKGLREAIDKIIDFISKENILDIRTFSVWFKNMFNQKATAGEIKQLKSLTEVKSMLATIAEKIEKRGKKQGKIENAKKMLMKGYSLQEISEITELSISEIQKLK
jgi:predicted transposase/invertase (TIGR01784 family)